MRNHLSIMDEAQQTELEQRIALELYIENFSPEDVLACFQEATQEELTKLALELQEKTPRISLAPKAQEKYGSIAKAIIQNQPNTPYRYYIQASQIFVDFGRQHDLI